MFTRIIPDAYTLQIVHEKRSVVMFTSFVFMLSEQQILSIIQERCDGNRNILHACVHMCAPTSNKEPDIGM